MTPETFEALVRRAAGRCEACGDLLDRGGFMDWPEAHHRQSRRHGGNGLDNLIYIHRACHQWITEHPHEARLNGWIVPSWDRPADVPVKIAKPWGQP